MSGAQVRAVAVLVVEGLGKFRILGFRLLDSLCLKRP